MSTHSERTPPLVSVIVPTYNYGHFMAQMLESVLGQTHARWECLVIDDGSTDNTAEIVGAYAASDPRVKYVRQQNQLQSAAKNLGLKMCAGQYVQFLDADDLIEARKLELQVAYLEKHRDVDIVYGGVRYFRTGNVGEHLYSMTEDNQSWMPQVSGVGQEVLRTLVQKNIMVINSPLVRRAIVERVGPFDVRLPPAEDWDYWLRCALAGARFRFVEMEGTLALVRLHSVSSSQNRIRMYRSILLMRKKLEALIEDEELLSLNRESGAANEGYLGVEEVALGSSLRGAWHFAKAVRMDRRWKGRLKWLICALASPVASRQSLESIITSSITQPIKSGGQKSDAA
jgi:glycosyltransferase involved in cell wall biosynthesis